MLGILGGGLSGLVLASRLRDAEVLEAEPTPGGLCRSLTVEGFTFDPHGSHILYSKDANALAFYEDLLRDNVCRRRRNTKVFYKGRYVKYPFENGLADLPPEDNLACLLGFIEAYVARKAALGAKPTNFREWMYHRFGAGITEAYLLPYNEKIWKTSAQDMGIEWVDGRVPDPPLEDVIKSSLGFSTEGYTHQLNFVYPRVGGVECLIRGVLPRVPRIRPGFRVTSVRRHGGRWIVGDGSEEQEYEDLVSTIPIPDLIGAMGDAPADVRAAAAGLQHRSLVTVMVGIGRPNLNEFSWVYFPRPEDGRFNRISFPSNFSDSVSPEGTSSAVAEITCVLGDDVWSSPDEALVEHVVERADRLGVFRRGDVVLAKVARTRHAYVVFDRAHARNLRLVKAYAAKEGIRLLGRFGQFEYINTDQCILRGLALAEELQVAA